MAITKSTAADRTTLRDRYARAGIPVNRSLESYLLLAASAVIAAGLILVFRAGSMRLAEAQPGAASGRLLELNQVGSAAELLPALGFLEDPEDRAFAARRIYDFLSAGRIEGIGELRRIRISMDQIGRSRGLSSFVTRLEEAKKQASSGAEVSIPLLTAPEVRRMRESLAVRTPDQYRRSLWLHALVFFAPFYLVHLLWRMLAFPGDRILLPLVHLLSGIGFIFMVRLRDPIRDALLFPDFAVGTAIGCGVLLACSLPDYERSPLRRLAFVPLLGSFLLSAVLLIFGSGPGESDAKVNLGIGGLTMQPVEVVKVLLVLFLAGYFASRWELFRELKEPARSLPRLLRGLELPRLRYVMPVVIAVGLATLFFFLQKDLGPALVFALVFLTLYGVSRARLAGVLLGFGVLVAAFWVGYHYSLPRTVSARVSIWLSPWDNYVRPGGDHLALSLWTFASGGLIGSGLGLGDPDLLPAVHTDMILAAVGEELGFAGLMCILILYGVLLHRALRISLSASGPYTLFLGLGFMLLFGFQIALIAGGVLGLVPLSGVVTPFLNYGKSSTVVNFAILGILIAVSAGHAPSEGRNVPFRGPMTWILGFFGLAAAAILIQAARVQLIAADEVMARGTLAVQGDGHRRYAYNPRLLAAGDGIPRGSVYDRNGIPLAVNTREQVEGHRAAYQSLGIDLDRVSAAGGGRLYPFGALTFHLLGDLRSRINWGATNTSFIERDLNVTLQGYDDHATVVAVRDRPEGPAGPVLRRDLRELIPLVRYRTRPMHEKVQRILRRDRDVRLTIDARLQKAVSEIVEQHIRAANRDRGAAVVIDPATGYLLASVTYPWAGAAEAANIQALGEEFFEASGFQASLFDRPRYGLYPPGSSFKLITATAALQAKDDAEEEVFECRRLADGRVGNFVRGWGRPIRDDVLDAAPHGMVKLAAGMVHSCNAYFAQLGTYVVGPERLLRTADLFGIRMASPNTPAQLRDALAQASYGQGQVVATPLQMARVAAAICNGGISCQAAWVPAQGTPACRPVMPAEHARLLSRFMRSVVTEGTGRGAKNSAVPVAGKTGTAELRDRPSHAWFVGFAPYGRPQAKKIAFAVIVENGRYGGRVAAPLAGDIAAAAARLGLIDRE